MVKCNQVCPWNYYEIGCKKPNDELCPMSNLATKEKPQTNADRIRAMSDEELANWLDYMYGRCDWCDTNKITTDDCSDIACTDCIFEWLKQPAEGE